MRHDPPSPGSARQRSSDAPLVVEQPADPGVGPVPHGPDARRNLLTANTPTLPGKQWVGVPNESEYRMNARLTEQTQRHDRLQVARLWLGRKLMGRYMEELESDYWTQFLTLQSTEAKLDHEVVLRTSAENTISDLASALACAERVAGIDALQYLQDERRHPSTYTEGEQ